MRAVALGVALLRRSGARRLGSGSRSRRAAALRPSFHLAALLIVTGGVFLLAGVLVALGVGRLSKKAAAPVEGEALSPRS